MNYYETDFFREQFFKVLKNAVESLEDHDTVKESVYFIKEITNGNGLNDKRRVDQLIANLIIQYDEMGDGEALDQMDSMFYNLLNE
jgi:hypothetical protein